jgi:hypothetical protein
MSANGGNANEPQIRRTTSTLSVASRRDHVLARLGVNRSGHRVEPGLYALGDPTPDSPVFVTANYTLSFDALRSALIGIDGYILVLDTRGINVWCAAGGGLFSNYEVIERINEVRLQDIVRHRVLILPQLSAPSIAALDLQKRSGFSVEFGPVRAEDLPAYLKARRATPEMRRVHFDLRDRLVLIPVELVHLLLPMAIAAVVLFLLGGWLPAAAVVASILAGTVLFPILLPVLPTREFSTKGFILGGLVALPFAATFWGQGSAAWWLQGLKSLSYLLAMPAVTAFLALNFTGSTPLTSRTGVRREIFAYIPVMAGMFAAGILLTIAFAVMRFVKG